MDGHRVAREVAFGPAHPHSRAKAYLSRRSFVAGMLLATLPPAIRPGVRQVPDSTPAPSPTATKRLQIVREQRPTYGEEPRRGGSLRLLRPAGRRDDFNPVAFRQDFQVAVSYLDPLVRPDEVTMEPRPWLAERWEWSEDGRVITYTLRSDVQWHDGSSLTADDVQFSFTVYRDDLDSGVRNFFSSMETIEAIDDRTVRVRLAAADGTWLFYASSQLIFLAAQYGEYWSYRPAGERMIIVFLFKVNLTAGNGQVVIEG